jgi:hypothetical protein
MVQFRVQAIPEWSEPELNPELFNLKWWWAIACVTTFLFSPSPLPSLPYSVSSSPSHWFTCRYFNITTLRNPKVFIFPAMWVQVMRSGVGENETG